MTAPELPRPKAIGTPWESLRVPDRRAAADAVNPSHYRAGCVECIEALEAACEGLDGFEGHLTATTIKYLWRWKHKHPGDPMTDLRKARWYLDRLIALQEAKR